MSKTKLEKLAIQRIGELTQEAQQVIIKNHVDMGQFDRRDSGFGALNSKLREMEAWVEALNEN